MKWSQTFRNAKFIILLVNSMPSVWKSNGSSLSFEGSDDFLWQICALSSSSHGYRKMNHKRNAFFLLAFHKHVQAVCCLFAQTVIIFAVFEACVFVYVHVHSFNTFGFSLVWHFLQSRRKLFNYLLFLEKKYANSTVCTRDVGFFHLSLDTTNSKNTRN